MAHGGPDARVTPGPSLRLPPALPPGGSREGAERAGAGVAPTLIKGASPRPPPKASSARRTWTSACCSPTPVRTGARAPTATGATAACASTAGAATTAARTSTTAPSPPARRGPPASTAWPPSPACARRARQVRAARRATRPGPGEGAAGRPDGHVPARH